MSNCQCSQSKGSCATEFQYAVKVVCGEVPTPQDNNVQTPVAPGRYWTAVNIHNPDKCKQATYRWKVAVANPGEPGPISAYQRTKRLTPDQAIELDNRQILSVLPKPPSFVKGYAVIESDVELDVVAVYTGNNGPCGSNSFHTERVQPRCVPVCEDLVLPLHTGVAAWQTVAPTPGALGPVVILNYPPGAIAAPPLGSQYVSQYSTDLQPTTPVGRRYYELCFDLCYGFTPPPQFDIQVRLDDTGRVLLNNVLLGNVALNTLTTLTVNPSLLRAGRNCFRVEVRNNQGNTTFALAGLFNVVRGKCPCGSSSSTANAQGHAGLTVESVEAHPAD